MIQRKNIQHSSDYYLWDHKNKKTSFPLKFPTMVPNCCKIISVSIYAKEVTAILRSAAEHILLLTEEEPFSYREGSKGDYNRQLGTGNH